MTSHIKPKSRARIAACRVIGYSFALWVDFAHATGKVIIEDEGGRAEMLKNGTPFIYAVWHGRMLGTCFDGKAGLDAAMIASHSDDGEIAAGYFARSGIGVIRGSSQNPRKPEKYKGGREALMEAVDGLRDGSQPCVMLTPDGPKGPRGHAKHGVATIAARAGVPIVPVAYSSAKPYITKSWDQLVVPKPFSKTVHLWGTPIPPAPDAQDHAAIAACQHRVEAEMNRLTRKADKMCNLAPDPAYAQGGAA